MLGQVSSHLGKQIFIHTTHCISEKIPKEFQSSNVKSETRVLEEIVVEFIYTLGVEKNFQTVINVLVMRAV